MYPYELPTAVTYLMKIKKCVTKALEKKVLPKDQAEQLEESIWHFRTAAFEHDAEEGLEGYVTEAMESLQSALHLVPENRRKQFEEHVKGLPRLIPKRRAPIRV